MKIRFAVVGTGWRSEFYARIAKALPEQFQMVAWLCRSREKMEKLYEKYGIHTTMSEEDIMCLKPDFIVCAVNKESISDVTLYWAKTGVPVLSETPAALDLDTIRDMKRKIDQGYKIQVAEQYFLEPDIRAMIDEIDAATIGEPVSITLSAMHDYHAVSVIRRLLKTNFSPVQMIGKAYSLKVANTKTRYETLTDGKIIDAAEKHLIMEYEGGKVAFYDFMSEQYRSPIRNRYINVRGTRGEIINDTVFYLNQHNMGESKKLNVINQYEKEGLNYDETAVADMLLGMKKYVDTGIEAYPMDEALYDAYLSILMTEAGNAGFKIIKGSFTEIL